MSKFLFEKAEMTFTYLEILLNILESLGLHGHCIPIIVFLKFFAKEILNNHNISLLMELKFAKVLNLMNYHEQADTIV